ARSRCAVSGDSWANGAAPPAAVAACSRARTAAGRLGWARAGRPCYQGGPAAGARPARGRSSPDTKRGRAMRNMLAFLAAVVLTVGGLGWYLDWYKVRSHPAEEGHHNLSIDINTTKIGT